MTMTAKTIAKQSTVVSTLGGLSKTRDGRKRKHIIYGQHNLIRFTLFKRKKKVSGRVLIGTICLVFFFFTLGSKSIRKKSII